MSAVVSRPDSSAWPAHTAWLLTALGCCSACCVPAALDAVRQNQPAVSALIARALLAVPDSVLCLTASAGAALPALALLTMHAVPPESVVAALHAFLIVQTQLCPAVPAEAAEAAVPAGHAGPVEHAVHAPLSAFANEEVLAADEAAVLGGCAVHAGPHLPAGHQLPAEHAVPTGLHVPPAPQLPAEHAVLAELHSPSAPQLPAESWVLAPPPESKTRFPLVFKHTSHVGLHQG